MLVENQTCFTFLYVVGNTLNSLMNEHAHARLAFFKKIPPYHWQNLPSVLVYLGLLVYYLGSLEYVWFFKNKSRVHLLLSH